LKQQRIISLYCGRNKLQSIWLPAFVVVAFGGHMFLL